VEGNSGVGDLVKIGFIIVAIIILIRFKLPLSISLIASAAALGLLFRLPVAEMQAAFLRGLLKEMLAASSAMNSIAAELSRMGMPTAVSGARKLIRTSDYSG